MYLNLHHKWYFKRISMKIKNGFISHDYNLITLTRKLRSCQFDMKFNFEYQFRLNFGSIQKSNYKFHENAFIGVIIWMCALACFCCFVSNWQNKREIPYMIDLPILPVSFSKAKYWFWLNFEHELKLHITGSTKCRKCLAHEKFHLRWIYPCEEKVAYTY